MGLFKKLFGGGEQPSSQPPTQNSEHEENWATYFTRVNDESTGSIIVDLGFASTAPDGARPHLVTFVLNISDRTENGLPSNDERNTLNAIENTVIDDLINRHAAVNPGHLYCENKLEVFFYAANPEGIEETVSLRMTDYPDYAFALSHEDDPEWNTYFDLLFPSPIQMQSIGNRQVIENMRSHGDNLQAERPVDHWICFTSEEDRDHFIKAIDHMGFEILSKPYEEDRDEPFSLNISRTDRVDPDSVDQYVLELWQIAQDCNGRYDGWGALVVKDDESPLSH